MKSKLSITLLATIIAVVAVIAVLAQTQKTAPRQNWEYLEIAVQETQNATPVLTRYGNEGWELVNVSPACKQNGCTFYAYFKRPR